MVVEFVDEVPYGNLSLQSSQTHKLVKV